MKNKLVKITLVGMLILSVSSFAAGKPRKNTKKGKVNGNVNIVVNSSQSRISPERAKQIALNHARVSSSSIRKIKVERDFEYNRPVYEVEFETRNGRDYDYTIDARTGAILDFEQD